MGEKKKMRKWRCACDTGRCCVAGEEKPEGCISETVYMYRIAHWKEEVGQMPGEGKCKKCGKELPEPQMENVR